MANTALLVRLPPVEFISDLDATSRAQFIRLVHAWRLEALTTGSLYRWRFQPADTGGLDLWFCGGGRGIVFARGTTEVVGLIDRFELQAEDTALERQLRWAQSQLHQQAPHYDDEFQLAP